MHFAQLLEWWTPSLASSGRDVWKSVNRLATGPGSMLNEAEFHNPIRLTFITLIARRVVEHCRVEELYPSDWPMSDLIETFRTNVTPSVHSRYFVQMHYWYYESLPQLYDPAHIHVRILYEYLLSIHYYAYYRYKIIL